MASGDRLYWISLKESSAGQVLRMFPESEAHMGYGRGVLAGDTVYWPTRTQIYLFDRRTALPKKVVELLPRDMVGGNLLVAAGHLIVATPTELVALRRHRAPGREAGAPRVVEFRVGTVAVLTPRK